MSELIDRTGLSRAATKQQLRLNHVRRIVRTQDFFIIVSPEEQLIGTPPAVEWLDVSEGGAASSPDKPPFVRCCKERDSSNTNTKERVLMKLWPPSTVPR